MVDISLGDSIAVNGVCLTAVRFDDHVFQADVMAETLTASNLGALQPGNRVNLERALRLADRLGGHLVQGHVDGVGTIMEKVKQDIALVIRIRAPHEILNFTVPKGSITIDGISLTVVEVAGDNFTVSIIPHTAALTTLGFKQAGTSVNLETDIVGRYIYKFIHLPPDPGSQSSITAAFLTENGFF